MISLADLSGMSISGGYAGAASAWWLIILGVILLFFPPLFWLGIILIVLGIISGIVAWVRGGDSGERQERQGIRERGDQASEYLAGISGGWLVVLGVLLFIIPTPLTTLVGIVLILIGIGVWIAAWWSS